MNKDTERSKKLKVLEDALNARNALRNQYTVQRVMSQQQSQMAEGALQPLLNRLDRPKFEKPNNEEIRLFFADNGITFDFLSPKSELSFVKGENGEVKVYLGKNPNTWKEVSIVGEKIKIEGKDKSFDKKNDITWKLLEGKDVDKLGLSKSQIKKWTKDYIAMNDDRSTVITNVRNIKNVTRPSRSPSTSLIPEDENYQDDTSTIAPNLTLAGSPAEEWLKQQTPDMESMNQQLYIEGINSVINTENTNRKELSNYLNYVSGKSKTFKDYLSDAGINALSDPRQINQFVIDQRNDFPNFHHNTKIMLNTYLPPLEKTLKVILQNRMGVVKRIYQDSPELFREVANTVSENELDDLAKVNNVYNALIQRVQHYQQQGRLHQGQGIPPKVIIIPESKDELFDRLHILIAAKHAGSNAVEDEKRAILQRLLDKKWITEKDYKKLNKVKIRL